VVGDQEGADFTKLRFGHRLLTYFYPSNFGRISIQEQQILIYLKIMENNYGLLGIFKALNVTITNLNSTVFPLNYDRNGLIKSTPGLPHQGQVQGIERGPMLRRLFSAILAFFCKKV
jgi:hypothetical protein